jgi:DNA (cytosine-5)-methyltransferase 1
MLMLRQALAAPRFADLLVPGDGPSFIDMFCGAGGSSIGLSQAGFRLVAAMNHWERAIDTHAKNFGHLAEHLCEDVNAYDLRRLPPARVLWASPICTELSPSGGNSAHKKIAPEVIDGEEQDPLPKEAYIRTRTTFYDVLRATEIWGYDAVLIENVVEAAWRWPLFEWFLQAMKLFGYNAQILCASTAHVHGENELAPPQWRNRMFLVFTRIGIALPDLAVRPLSFCAACRDDVRGEQRFKPGTRTYDGIPVGKFRQQYEYHCPRLGCGAVVDPYVTPAAAILDLDDLGPTIGERRRPLAPASQERVRAALALLGDRALLHLNHGKADDGRPSAPELAPLSTRTARIGDGMATRPQALIMLRAHSHPVLPGEAPLSTIAAGGNHHAVLTAPDGGHRRARALETVVVPYRKCSTPYLPTRPLHTVSTKPAHAILRAEQDRLDLASCHYRMVNPDEHLAAQGFPGSASASGLYVVGGNKAERTKQAGNAVSCNVARHIGERVRAVLA